MTKLAPIAIVLTLALLPSAAAAQDAEALTLGYQPGSYFMGGLTGGGSAGHDGGGGFLGAELSLARLRRGVWYGAYVDGSRDFGRSETLFTAGPELGWNVIGIDGGVGVRRRSGAFDIGPQFRALLTFGLLSFYARFAFFRDAERFRPTKQFGAMLKIPLAAPWGFGPAPAWDMGEPPQERR